MTAEQRLKWRQADRLGMFVPWGSWTLLAGHWQGERRAGIGGWIVRNANIPSPAYEPLAKQPPCKRAPMPEHARPAGDLGRERIGQ